MSLFNQYSYPQPSNITVQMEGGEVNFTEQVARDHKQFIVQDDLNKHYAVPIKAIEHDGLYALVIPVTNNILNFDWSAFSRDLHINANGSWGVSPGNKKFIPVVRPEGKKAYLHAVVAGAYDFNEMLPYFDTSSLFGGLTPGLVDLVVPNAFGTTDGLIVHKSVSDPTNLMSNPRSPGYSTAHFPVYRTNTLRRSDELRVMESLGQNGLRSSIRGGLLPSDIWWNQFRMMIAGINSATPTIDNANDSIIWDTNAGNDSSTYNSGSQYDNMLPQESNEKDILIPDAVNWLRVNVTGTGWYHFIDWKQQEDHVKGIWGSARAFLTIVQMPVKVKLVLRYA